MQAVKIEAVAVHADQLQPGDLFSTVGPEYWDAFPAMPSRSIAERVYVRTTEPGPPDQADLVVYRLHIEHQRE